MKLIRDLQFPLIDEFRKVPEAEFAKQRVLLRYVRFSIENNKCNYLELASDGVWYLNIATIYNYGSSIVFQQCPLLVMYSHFYFSHVAGDLYTMLNKNYCIIRDNKILCIFSIVGCPILNSYDIKNGNIILESTSKNFKVVISPSMELSIVN